MMTQQQQQILVRSALAAGVTLAVGLASVGFAAGSTSERTAAPTAAEAQVATVNSEPDRPVTGAQAPSFAVPETLPSAPAAPVVAAAFASASEGPVEFVRAFGDEDDEDDDEDEDGEHEDEHSEREGDREALRRASERREHR